MSGEKILWAIAKIGILTAMLMRMFGDSFLESLTFTTLAVAADDFMKYRFNILLRLRCWMNGICYKHQRLKYVGQFSGAYLWCDDCVRERGQRRHDRQERLMQQAKDRQQ